MDNAPRLPPRGCCNPAGYSLGYRVRLCSTRVGHVPSPNSRSSRIASAIGAAVLAGLLRARRTSDVGTAAARMAAPHAELLVDADSHSTEEVLAGIRCLQGRGWCVQTTIFAEPGRMENWKWRRLIKRHGVTFRPVRRSREYTREPNDDAINAAMRRMAGSSDVILGLLTKDKDFVHTMQEVQATGTRVLALVPNKAHYSLIRGYRVQRIEVQEISTSKETTGPRVRAELHSHGSGSVHFSDPYINSALDREGKKAVLNVLDELGYRERRGVALTLPAVAKFWYCNGLGSLTVFPQQLATTAMQDVIERERTRKWEPCSRNLAFVLPETAGNKKTQARIQKYGNLEARRIYQGGGPFILKDSPDLVPHVLRKLGFLDTGLNSDLTEAMFCFLNSNAKLLRKPGLLPETGQGSSLVEEQLRDAFLSPFFNGRCTVPGRRWPHIQSRLVKRGAVTARTSHLTNGDLRSNEAVCKEARLAVDANIQRAGHADPATYQQGSKQQSCLRNT